MSDDIVKLAHPFEHNGTMITELKFKKVKIKDRLALAEYLDELNEPTHKKGLDFDIKCLAYLTGQDRSLFEEMTDDCFEDVRAKGAVFMPKGWSNYLLPSEA